MLQHDQAGAFVCVRVELIPQYNCNGLVAQRNISAGEHLFSEEPFVWAREEGATHGLTAAQEKQLTDRWVLVHVRGRWCGCDRCPCKVKLQY